MDITTLATMELFSGLSDDELAACAACFEEREVLAGTTLIREGDFSYRFFVVLEGEVTVLQEFVSVATLGMGACFGEMGVAADTVRNARVVATERTRVATMMSWDFHRLCAEVPTFCDRIAAVIKQRTPVAG